MSKVSVIIPCYNYGRFLGETLESLFQQSYPHWEAIVVDDGSTDNTRDVAQHYIEKDARIKYVYQENQGLPSARNTGIENATGEYIQFLDSDDLLQIDKFKLQVAYLEKHPNVAMVYCGLRYFYDTDATVLYKTIERKNHTWHLQKSGKGVDLLPFLVISCVIMPPMPMLRKSTMLKEVGMFTKDLKSCEDWEFWLRCAIANLEIYYLDAPNTFSLMRIHKNSMTQNRKVMIPSMIELRKRINVHLPNSNIQNLNHKFLRNSQIEMAIYKKKTENSLEAIKYLNHQGTGTIFFVWKLLIRIISPTLAYKLLAIQRSLMKKVYYLKN